MGFFLQAPPHHRCLVRKYCVRFDDSSVPSLSSSSLAEGPEVTKVMLIVISFTGWQRMMVSSV
jgi:hypothetical protein